LQLKFRDYLGSECKLPLPKYDCGAFNAYIGSAPLQQLSPTLMKQPFRELDPTVDQKVAAGASKPKRPSGKLSKGAHDRSHEGRVLV